MRAMIFGGGGTLGSALVRELGSSFQVAATRRVPNDSGNLIFDFMDPKFDPNILEYMRQSDVVVVSAAVPVDGLLLSMSPEAIRRGIQVNLETPLLIAKNFIKERVSIGNPGRIIFIGSIAGETGFKGLSVYGATKAGLVATAKSISREYGSRNIRAFVVAPGFFESSMTQGLTNSQLDSIARRTPGSNLVTAQQVASAVRLLAQGKLDGMNGRVLTFDNGGTI